MMIAAVLRWRFQRILSGLSNDGAGSLIAGAVNEVCDDERGCAEIGLPNHC